MKNIGYYSKVFKRLIKMKWNKIKIRGKDPSLIVCEKSLERKNYFLLSSLILAFLPLSALR